MEAIGIRALKQNASAVVARAAAGASITVTDRGRPVAQIVPLPGGRLAQLRAAGLTRPPLESLADLGPPAPAHPGTKSLSEIVEAQRADERY